MTKAIIYKDENSSAVFCIDGRIFFKSNNSRYYVEAQEILNSLKLIKTKGITKRKELIEKMLKMKYDEAARFHLNNQISKGRTGKLFEGEFNETQDFDIRNMPRGTYVGAKPSGQKYKDLKEYKKRWVQYDK